MKFEIKSRLNGSVLFSMETESVKLCLEAAVKSRADLTGADLRGADLEGADLTGADLEGAYLEGADLRGAYLRGADLTGADLEGAYLEGADLRGAYLTGAYLRGAYLEGADLTGAYLEGAYLEGADLRGAYLTGADLTGADLEGAYLEGAYLQPIRDDFWAVLSSAPSEVPALIEAIKTGKVDGSTYTGDCACLVGTIANARGVRYDSLGILSPKSSRPAEKFFLGINKGDTPETNQFSKIALEWAETWLSNIQAAFAK